MRGLWHIVWREGEGELVLGAERARLMAHCVMAEQGVKNTPAGLPAALPGD
jgi:hypothetical protein